MNKSKLLWAVFLLGLFILGIRETHDPDLWWHLKSGEYILTHGIPSTDPFSYTLYGQPWVPHEWLSDVLLYQLHRMGGLGALILFFSAWMVPTFIWVYRRTPGKISLAAPVCILGAIIVHLFWGARPQVLNIAMLSFFLWILEGIQLQKLKFAWLFTLPFLLILWENLHSGFVLGAGILGLFWFCECMEKYFPRAEFSLNCRKRYAVLGVLCASLLAGGLNPYGYKIFTYPLITMGNPIQQEVIEEWQSPDFHFFDMRILLAFLILSVWSFIITRRKASWFEMLLYLGSLLAGLGSVRHVPFFVIVSAPIICRNLEGIFPPLERLFSNRFQSLPKQLIDGAILSLLLIAGIIYTHLEIQKNQTKIDSIFPVKAVNFIYEKNWQNLRGLNLYSWGGYLIWRKVKVFIDGRADMYQDTVLRDYVTITGRNAGWESLLERYSIDYIILENEASFSNFLRSHGGWSPVYKDKTAVIFQKKQ